MLGQRDQMTLGFVDIPASEAWNNPLFTAKTVFVVFVFLLSNVVLVECCVLYFLRLPVGMCSLTHRRYYTTHFWNAHPPKTRCSASCLKLYTKALNAKHLLHETLYLKPSPKPLRSRKLLRFFVELLSTTGAITTPIPPALQSFIPASGLQPPGCDLPRNAWVRLNRLRTVVGRFAANMNTMGLCGTALCECGKVQTAHHILHGCNQSKPPCHIYEMDKPAL